MDIGGTNVVDTIHRLAASTYLRIWWILYDVYSDNKARKEEGKKIIMELSSVLRGISLEYAPSRRIERAAVVAVPGCNRQ